MKGKRESSGQAVLFKFTFPAFEAHLDMKFPFPDRCPVKIPTFIGAHLPLKFSADT
jgi:hypothetical protein